MDKNFLVIGGDLRIVKLVNMLADKNIIYTYGLEKSRELDSNDNIIKCNKINEEVIQKNNVIIGPTPFSKDGINIYAPYANDEIKINDIVRKCNKKHLIAGSVKEDILKTAEENNVSITDIIKNEKLAILNCISTAEGAIEVAIKETDRVIHGNNVLILGFGRVAKVLSKKLQGLSCNVTCAVRKKEAFAWTEAYGYNSVDINELGKNLSKYDIIFNTVPNVILTRKRLEYVNKECLIIELASMPGGIDRKAAKEKTIKVVEALALPGKVAPTTTAEFMKDVILESL